MNLLLITVLSKVIRLVVTLGTRQMANLHRCQNKHCSYKENLQPQIVLAVLLFIFLEDIYFLEEITGKQTKNSSKFS